MNFEAFEKDLQKLESPAPEDSANPLRSLRHDLQSLSTTTQRSDAHQAWAWTRLQARLRENKQPSRIPLLWKWLVPAALALITTLVWGLNNEAASGLTPLNSGIYVSSFQMSGTRADVLWVEGYDDALGNMP